MDVSFIIDGLNDAQRQAVSAPMQPQLVLAGAGSGKTRVLVHRIAWLIQVENLSPYSILSVTFTNKAAAEMRGRIEHLLQIPVGGLWVGTFHGLAHRLLRAHWKEAKLPQTFQILDSDDQQRLLKRVLRGLQLDEKQYPPRQVQWFINGNKDEGLRPQAMQDPGDPYNRQLIRIYSAYEQECAKNGVVDFAELLLRALETLRDTPALLTHYRRRFRYVLVDEFQDTNTIQYNWLRLIAGEDIPIFAVGDDDQSIYGWRGAKIENILNFTKDYPSTETIRLEQNYRSTGTILNAANALIANNGSRLGKNLWTSLGDGQAIDLYSAYNEQDEARYVADRIEQFVEQGQKRQDVAILYRSNAQSRTFESVFNQRKLPYRVYGGLRFYERAEIKDALSYCRLAANPNDNTAFERIINQPPRGIGERTISTIREFATQEDLSLWQACVRLSQAAGLTARAANALRTFIALIESFKPQREALPLHELIDHILDMTHLKDHYAKEAGEKGQARIENLDELITAAQGFIPDPEEQGIMDELSAFLSYAALEAGEGQGSAWDDCVQLMTMHSAKGLEFPLVFICGLEEGLFPHQMSIEEPGRLEEERRLCYVGITRAQRQLVLTYAESRRLHGSERFNRPSRFLGELPRDLIHEIRPAVKAQAASQYQTRSAKDFKAPAPDGVEVGARVTHPKFGEGVITSHEGTGPHARVQVNFANAGSKWLVLAYANLSQV